MKLKTIIICGALMIVGVARGSEIEPSGAAVILAVSSYCDAEMPFGADSFITEEIARTSIETVRNEAIMFAARLATRPELRDAVCAISRERGIIR